MQILQEKGRLSSRTQQVITNSLTTVIKEILSPRTEFWESGKTLKVLAEESYFRPDNSTDVQWPEAIRVMLADSKI